MRKYVRYLVLFLVLSASILVHELAHYATMRAVGVTVVRFTIGFGLTLWSTTLPDGVEFAIKPIVLGGYTEPIKEGPGSLEEASAIAKLAVSISGTVVNALVAFLLLAYALRVILPRLKIEGRATFLAGSLAFGAWVFGPWRLIRRFFLRLFKGRKPSQEASGEGTVDLGDVIADEGKRFSLLGTVAWAANTNAGLAAFNMLPFRPFDGGAAVSVLVGAIGGHGAQIAFDASSVILFALAVVVLMFVDVLRAVFGR